ncbi:hypothetical protein BaRGS_00030053 [Batillaria attramentaria]|uniref:Uncharacterized protein n=1 Tax=Batillaria attramentaria TaxID=370345 RepID=A0ABD0JUV4_9CAEN|nr:hypothetical protein BaRGS_017628 [Batillaria attramentaria]
MFVLMASHEVGGCQCPSCHYATTAQNCQCCIYRQIGKRGYAPRLPSESSVPFVPDDSQLYRYQQPEDKLSSGRSPLPDILAFPQRTKMTYEKPDVIETYDGKPSNLGDVIQAQILQAFKAQRSSLMENLKQIAREIENINLSKAMESVINDVN